MSKMFGRARNTSSCELVDLHFTHTFLPAVYITVFIVGTLANCFGLKSVFTRLRKVRSLNIFMLNLGIADLLYLFTLPFLIVYYVQGSKWIFGNTFCKVTRFCFNLNLYGSIGFLTCISIYRYLGIVYPMKVMGKINSHHSISISILVWGLVLIQILPDMFFDKAPPNSSNACYDTTDDHSIEDYLPYSVGWSITGFVIPFLIILMCYGHIILVLATKANISSLLKQRCLRLVGVLTLLFIICFIPYHVFKNLNLMTRVLKRQGTCRSSFKGIYVAHQISRGLVCLNSAINPLVYLVGNDDFLLRLSDLGKRARMSIAGLSESVMYRKPTIAGHCMTNVEVD